MFVARFMVTECCAPLGPVNGRLSRSYHLDGLLPPVAENPTRACRHSSEGEEGSDEMDGGLEAGVGFVVARDDTAEFLEWAIHLSAVCTRYGMPTQPPASALRAGRDYPRSYASCVRGFPTMPHASTTWNGFAGASISCD